MSQLFPHFWIEINKANHFKLETSSPYSTRKDCLHAFWRALHVEPKLHLYHKYVWLRHLLSIQRGRQVSALWFLPLLSWPLPRGIFSSWLLWLLDSPMTLWTIVVLCSTCLIAHLLTAALLNLYLNQHMKIDYTKTQHHNKSLPIHTRHSDWWQLGVYQTYQYVYLSNHSLNISFWISVDQLKF